MTRKVLRKVEDLAKFTGRYGVKVGFPKGGAGDYPDGTSLLMVAIIHEFGNKFIPERSYLRSVMREQMQEYRRRIRTALLAIQRGDGTPASFLGKIGLLAVGHIKAKIIAIKTPPLAPSTIARKRAKAMASARRELGAKKAAALPSSATEPNPLVESGHLGQSVTHKVVA